jgi:hypothetical protein
VLYALLIHNDDQVHPAPGGPGWANLMAAYTALNDDLERRGVAFSGRPLQSPHTATTVRVRGGRRHMTDGPFAETKEWFSGFYLVECATLDEALDIAARIPSAAYGSVEVRPVLDLSHA